MPSNPVNEPNIDGAESIQTPGNVIFTNSTNPLETELGGVGTPVADGNQPVTNPVNFDNQDVEMVLGATAGTISDNATSPKESELGGVGTPVADGNQADNPQNFDNKGKDVTVGARGAIFDNATSPTEEFIGTAGVPVGDGNQPNFPVTFDNRGKNVTVAPDAGPPVGTVLYKEVTYVTGPVLNIGD